MLWNCYIVQAQFCTIIFANIIQVHYLNNNINIIHFLFELKLKYDIL